MQKMRHEADRLRKVLVSQPREEFNVNTNLEKHGYLSEVNLKRAQKQHSNLQERIQANGAEVINVAPDKQHPCSCFVRDTVTILPEGAIVARYGLPSRRGEEKRVIGELKKRDIPIIGEIEDPGTFEGAGETLIMGKTILLGQTKRTNAAGVQQFKEIVEPLGYDVRIIDVDDRFINLTCVLFVVGYDTLVAHPEYADLEQVAEFNVIVADEEEITPVGVCFLTLSDKKVMVMDDYKRTIENMKKQGVETISIDVSEFEKAGGGLSCMTLPIERD